MPAPDHEEILRRFAAIVGRSLHVEAAKVTADAYLDELGAESLDLIEISMGAEEAFDIWLSEKSILQTAKDIFGHDVLERNGVLTDEGKALLAARMPELDASALEGEVRVASLNRQFMRVSGWVRMIEGLIAASPSVCPKCGGELGKAMAFKRKCALCEAGISLVSGEELNRQWVLDYRAATASLRPE